MSKLIAETGKVKLKAFAFPVRIYATDAGPNGNLIHAAYKDLDGWMMMTWYGNGKCINSNENFDLVPIPQPYYFNIYTDDDGAGVWTGKVHNSLELALARKLSKNATTYKYTGGEIEKVEEK